MEQIKKHQFEEIDQQLFTDSFNCCWELLKKKEYYLSDRATNIFSKLSLNYGHDMYETMVIFMTEIIKSNKHKVAIEKSKVASTQIVTTEATRDSGYDDNYDQSDQQQQQQVDQVNIDINNSLDKMISEKRKISVHEIHSKKADNKKNNCDDPGYAENIQIVPLNENSVEKLHMIDFIEKEEKLFIEESITIKDEMLPVTDDSIDVDKTHNSDNQSIGLKIKSNEFFNSFNNNNNNQSCSNEVIENVEHQENTRIRTRSLAPEKYSFCTEEDDELSFTQDYDDIVDDDDDDDDGVFGNGLNQNEKLENKIKVSDQISFKERARVVKLALENPTWSLNMLRKYSGCKNINSRRELEVWKKQIERGGTLRQKMNLVNNWVIKKCIEKKKNREIITNQKIKTWGLEAKKKFKPENFSAHNSWLKILKQDYEITGKSSNLKINCNMQKKKFFSSYTYVPYEIKVKVVNLANENPHWSLDMLSEQSGFNIKNHGQLRYWKQTVRDFNRK